MDLIGDALRQAFMPKHEYQTLRDEDKAWLKLQRPICVVIVCMISIAIVVSTAISLKIVFPGDSGNRPFCYDLRLQPLPINATSAANAGDSDSFPGAFYLTDQETVDYYYMVLFLPSFILFLVSLAYLIAGGVRCLSILNLVFAIIFGLLAIFLGSSLLTLGSSCSVPLFWCYEVASWGLVVLYTATAILLRRKAAVILDEGNFSGRNLGLEMLETNPYEVTPDVERRVTEGFKTWMGSSLLSSDEEDEPDEHDEMPLTSISQSRQRLT
ncbi:Homoserine O-acetyltransferase [Bienertia sinuspersici]